jgi:outer membrane protein insertion porin family
MRNFITTLALFLVITVAFGQTTNLSSKEFLDYENARTYVIADITVTGVKFLQPTYLVNISGLYVGEELTIPGDKITQAINKYWNLGLFSDVKVFATKIEGNTIYLEIKLTEQPRLTKMNLHGVGKGEIKDIEEGIKLKPGNQVTENVLNNTIIFIKKHFNDKGFMNCGVEIVQKIDTSSGNRVTLDVNIDRGKKVKISNLDFVGNTDFKDARLRRTMKKTKQISINFFKPSKYIAEKYKEDKKNLLEFYNKNGYRDAKIIDEKLDKLNNKRVDLILTVEEGVKYFIRNIKWVGNTKYPSKSMDQILGMKKGDVYDQSVIQKRLFDDEDAVTSQYMDIGYLFFNVDPVEVNIEGDSIDLEMRITEGDPATINRVTVSGNTKTNEHVVRRELRTYPGELFSRTDIIRSVRELASLGHFNPENINPNIVPNPSDGTVDIEYQVEEKSNDQFELSGGYGGYGFVGSLGLRFANFSARKILDLKSWRPVPTGDGQTLSVRAQTNGTYYQAYNLSFVEPWFGGKKRNSFSTSFYYTITKPYRRFGDESSDNFFRVLGASVGLGRNLKWPDDYFVLYTEVGFQRYHLNNWGSNFLINDGYSHVIDFTVSLNRSSQDQMIFPRRGSSFSFGVQFTPPISYFKKDHFWEISDVDKMIIRYNITKENPYFDDNMIDQYTETEIESHENAKKYKFIEYHKWTFDGAWYTTIIKNMVLYNKAEFGYLGYYNSGIGASPFEKFEVGGSGLTGYNLYGTDIVALRGYAEGTLTPTTAVTRNGSKVLIEDGNVYVKYTMELRYLITASQQATFYGLAFLEGGNAWSDIKMFNPFSIKRSAGFGIRAYLPMFGLLGVDWGFGFDLPNSGDLSPDERKRGYHGGEIHFVMGQQF